MSVVVADKDVVNHKDAVGRALDAGHLWVLMRSGRYWKLRRNGKTQTWKRDPSRFRIPVKAGLYEYWGISPSSSDNLEHRLSSE